MRKGTDDYPPEPKEEWRLFATTEELSAEMALCEVPLEMEPREALRVLALNGSWTTRRAVVKAQAWRKGSVSEMA